MDPLAVRLFRALEEAGVRYSCWKSTDKLEAALSGVTDLDVLVAREDAACFDHLAGRLGFRAFDSEPWRRYPGLVDLIGYDPGLRRLVHLHLHHQLLLGRGRIKEVRLPVEPLYLASACTAHGVRVPPPELEFAVWVVRTAFRVSLRDRLRGVVRGDPLAVFARQLPEYGSLRRRVDAVRLRTLLEDDDLDFLPADAVLAALADLSTLSARVRRAIRSRVAVYSRYGPLERPAVIALRRCGPFLDRLAGRPEGKRSRTGGVVVAFVGPDGAGKSTLCRAVAEALGGLVATHTAYMGASRDHAATRLLRAFTALTRLPFRIARKACRLLGLAAAERALTVLYQTLTAVMWARDKAWRFRRAWAAASNGQVVLTDRYPLFSGYGDREVIQPSTSRVLAALQRDEAAQLRKIASPDLIFFLDVAAEVSRARKPGQTETVETIHEKREAFREFFDRNRSAGQPYHIPEDMTVEERTHLVLGVIFSRLGGGDVAPSAAPSAGGAATAPRTRIREGTGHARRGSSPAPADRRP